MEKFGIFELLDALSAAMPAEKDAPVSAKREEAAPGKRPDAGESAFLPPTYAAPENKEPAKGAESFPPREKGNAASALLERHETMSRRIDKNK